MVPFQILHEMSYLSVQLISCQFQYQLYGFFDLQNVCFPCTSCLYSKRITESSQNGLFIMIANSITNGIQLKMTRPKSLGFHSI